MSTTTPGAVPLTPPTGRYGADPAAADRRMKRWYQVVSALAVLLVAGLSTAYVLQSSVNGEVEAFQVVSSSKVLIHLQVTKSAGSAGNCTVRSRDANGNEVGRVTVAIPKADSTYDTIVDLKTSGLGTTGELVSCSS
ncbi:DUF4307 domain-containing protein [Streptacidiphilus sp. P02-A3a]|uniref:DUF4307 domain-containing protein n=1 Tax=Streptacidiphilus sp. P02-A3a TaxID=2704468 RepID=UPI0015FC2306|nr:DUF4307 domain-containing protein [Streptacidiphilus sp. P02-A3a]QMU67643.1 DUF4307 domain-containing protein [Streptacidiphilus sp. P02-A3a]